MSIQTKLHRQPRSILPVLLRRSAQRGAEHGFTLIELMAVVAIVAILGALTLPTYFDRLVRQQIEEALSLADMAKRSVAASWANSQTWPSDNKNANLPKSQQLVNNYVTSTSVVDGVITITFGNNSAGAIRYKTLTIRPAIVPDAPSVPIAWVCGKANIPGNMKVIGVDRTTVPMHLLPITCRGSGVVNTD